MLNYQQSRETPDRYEFVYTVLSNGPAAQAPNSLGRGTVFQATNDLELPDTIVGVKTIAIDWRFQCAANYPTGTGPATFVWLPTVTVSSFSGSFNVSGVEYTAPTLFWQMKPEDGIVDKYLFPFSQSSRKISWIGFETFSQTPDSNTLGQNPIVTSTTFQRISLTIKIIAYKEYIQPLPEIRG